MYVCMEGVHRSAQATCPYVSTIAVCVHAPHGHVSLGAHTGCACVCTRTQGCTHVSAHASMPWYTQELLALCPRLDSVPSALGRVPRGASSHSTHFRFSDPACILGV